MTREIHLPGGAAVRRGGVSAALLLVLGGCAFDALNPGAIQEETLGTEPALVGLVNGVVGDYDSAYQRTALYTGLLSDEIRASGSWSWWHDADRTGFIDPEAPDGDLFNIPHHFWRPLQRARFLAEETYGRIQEHAESPESSPLAAMARLYSGMARLDIGDMFCYAAYDGGPRVEREESLEIAAQHLTEAIAIATAAGVDSTAQMARLMRARVRLAQGDYPGAAEDASGVPDGFLWIAHFRNAPGETNNMFFQLNQRVEGTVEEPFRATGDPRVPVDNTGKKGADNVTPRFDQKKYPDEFTPMPMGTWQEARLIQAEDLIRKGQTASGVELLNDVRAAAGLPALDMGMSNADAMTALKTERKMELFLTGRRYSDMRRFGGFPADWKGNCFPVPLVETQNNPNLNGEA
ncbi:MAG TPA: RagB/SusD family nutrient uptake outer membrane protein [Gemmatimonadales bacterium]